MPSKQETENNDEGSIPSWRRSGSFRNRNQDSEPVNSLSSSKYKFQNIFLLRVIILNVLYFRWSWLKYKNDNKFLVIIMFFFVEIEEKEKSIKLSQSPVKVREEPEVVLRRTHSFETDEKWVFF